MRAIYVLSQTYVAIEEPALGYRTVLRGLEELSRAGIADAEFRARLLNPSDVNDRPELIWGTFRQQLPEVVRLVEIERDRLLNDPVEIDMRLIPSQIVAALEYQRPTAG